MKSPQYRTAISQQQEAQEKSQEVAQLLESYLASPLERLDAYLDHRLVKTFVETMRALIEMRNQSPGLTISELGSYIMSGAQAPAGEKRLHNLLTSEKWSEEIIKVFLWNEAKKRYEMLQKEGEQVLVIWDGSVVEKPESQKAEDLCAVKSSKAARRKKSRKGSFNQPGGKPIVVLGWEWSACVVVGMHGKPALAMMEFSSRKGPEAIKQRVVEEGMLYVAAMTWRKTVWHVFDRGYAAGRWIELFGTYGIQFLVRWKKGHHFVDEQGVEKSLGQIGKTKRSWSYRMIRDGRTHEVKKTGIVAVPVRHARYAGPLWVVIVRRGGEPWYLITNSPVETEEQAWKCYKAYCRRWQVETVFRYEKSELAIETIRMWKRDKRQKFLHMIALVHAFLFLLLDEQSQELVQWILHHYCRRRGKKQREAKVPLYRLRWGLSRLWQECRPIFSFACSLRVQRASPLDANSCSQNSG
jgi:hypothetical protein